MNKEPLETLVAWLLQGQAQFQRVVFRVSVPEYATREHLLSGNGAKERGGRWNPVGCATLYTALDESTALAEFGSRFESFVLPAKARARILTVTPIGVTLDRVVDLSGEAFDSVEASLRAAFFAADYRSGSTPRAPSQDLGERLAAAGVQGLRVPSVARAGGECLVLFRQNVPSAAFTLPDDVLD